MVSSLMAKLFGYIMESNVSAWVETKNKRTYVQASLQKHKSTINHLVTLQILMEERHLRG